MREEVDKLHTKYTQLIETLDIINSPRGEVSTAIKCFKEITKDLAELLEIEKPLSVRTLNALERATGYNQDCFDDGNELYDIICAMIHEQGREITKDNIIQELYRMREMGKKSVNEVMVKIKPYIK
jgi:hypothetical protein